MGSLVDGVGTNALNLFLLFYLTVICGMSGAAAGVALSVGLIVDAVFDPLLGAVSDGWRSPWGRRLPFLVIGVIPAALGFIAIFTLPRLVGPSALFPVVLTLSIALRVSISTFNLPYQALGAELTDSYVERSSIAAWRWGLGMTGVLACIVLGFGVFFTGTKGLMRAGAYAPFAAASSLILIGGALVSIRTIYALRTRAHAAPSSPGSLSQFAHELGEMFRNPSFRALFASALLFFSGFTLNQSVSLHANTFFWGLKSGEIQAVTLATFAGLIVGAPVTTPLVLRLEKKTAVLFGLCGLVVTQAGPFVLRLMGWLPLEHGALVWTLSVDAFIGGLLLSTAGIAFSSMMADAADEHEILFSKRREGLYFAGWAFAAKAANGLGALFAGVALQLIGFPRDLGSGAGGHPLLSPQTVGSLGVVAGPCAGVLSLLGVAFLLRYKLDRKGHAAMLAVLAERRGGAG